MTIKMLGIAPYPGLRDLLRDVAADKPGIAMDVAIADLEEAIPLAKNAEINGYEVIVSRGGTASLIRELVSIPVVNISVSGYDILRVLTLVKDSHTKVAIIGFPNICEGATTVSSLLDFEIPIYTIHDESEVKRVIAQAVGSGAQIILGDVVTVRITQEMGYNGILITSGRESVMEAITDAGQVNELYRRERERTKFYERLATHSPQGIVVVDHDCIIQFINDAAVNLLRTDLQTAVGKSLTGILPDLGAVVSAGIQRGDQQFGREDFSLGDQDVKLDVVKTLDSSPPEYIIYLQPLRQRHNTEEWVQTWGQQNRPGRQITFAQIIGSSSVLQNAITQARVFAQSDKNVWISGMLGSGRSAFAQAIHAASSRHAEPFEAVSCKFTPPSGLKNRLFGDAGVFRAARGTIYLADVDHLELGMQEELCYHLQASVPQRIIVSSTLPWSEVGAQSEFLKELAYRVGELHLQVPALKEHLDDIDETVRVLIAEHNLQYGKHIVGIRPEVLQRLKGHSWPGNLKELRLVVGELLLHTTGHYAGLEEYNAAWQRYQSSNTRFSDWKTDAPIDLSGSWEEIEQRILLQVLMDEGMNQSKAANRLGLNRSTLWRKLHNVLQKEDKV